MQIIRIYSRANISNLTVKWSSSSKLEVLEALLRKVINVSSPCTRVIWSQIKKRARIRTLLLLEVMRIHTVSATHNWVTLIINYKTICKIWALSSWMMNQIISLSHSMTKKGLLISRMIQPVFKFKTTSIKLCTREPLMLFKRAILLSNLNHPWVWATSTKSRLLTSLIFQGLELYPCPLVLEATCKVMKARGRINSKNREHPLAI